MTKESAWEMLQICCLFLINFQDLHTPGKHRPFLLAFLLFTRRHPNDDEECSTKLITYWKEQMAQPSLCARNFNKIFCPRFFIQHSLVQATKHKTLCISLIAEHVPGIPNTFFIFTSVSQQTKKYLWHFSININRLSTSATVKHLWVFVVPCAVSEKKGGFHNITANRWDSKKKKLLNEEEKNRNQL